MGDSLNLSPVVILLSLVLFGWMWGMVGAFAFCADRSGHQNFL